MEPDAVRAPGYPLFLSLLIDQITFSELAKVTSIQALASTTVVLITYFVCAQLVSWWLAIAVSFFVAISPHLINANVYILTESMATFVLMVFTVGVVCAAKRRSLFFWFLVGAFLGVCALVRPAFQYFPPLLACFLFFQFEKRAAWRYALSMVLGFLALMLPWVLRNIAVLGQMSDPHLMINFLHHGMYPSFVYGGDSTTFGFPYRYDPDSHVIAQSVSSVLKHIFSSVLSDPLLYLRWYFCEKPAFLWSWSIVQGAGDAFVYPVLKSPYVESVLFQITHAISAWTHLPSVILALIGSVVVWLPCSKACFREHSLLIVRVFSLLIVYYTALHMIGAPFPRYSVPFRPLMYIMSAVGLWATLSAVGVWRLNWVNRRNRGS
ncbi:hypothetical protein ATO7_05225 [Oceanococcus atlanticus]|uniref:Glycosyltransferase RgtA/B/C/D-like domain-containing protein n=1 Tax=Oceanococcus atlanticus TaxID=1317117 RepID=A0A1Y1SHX6_9GAMM|nr:hypothetical protein ATO7_05225 [Oceanococcus atlanticus]